MYVCGVLLLIAQRKLKQEKHARLGSVARPSSRDGLSLGVCGRRAWCEAGGEEKSGRGVCVLGAAVRAGLECVVERRGE